LEAEVDQKQRIREQLAIHEGRKSKLYADTANPPKITGGIGHNFTDNPVPGIPAEKGFELTDRQIDDLFEIDLDEAVKQLDNAYPLYRSFAAPVYFALVNMVFNMGIARVSGFHKMHAALTRQDYPEAARQMLDSAWAHQVGDWPPDSELAQKHSRPGRAWELAFQVSTNEWWEG
jgi:lysozyme